MSIRVIAGSAKGRKLKLVPGDTTRPIMDRAKEALFNIIGQDIVDSTFWDVFAGTGSVGIEALSRGAAYALFTDSERRAVGTVRDNLKHTQLDAKGDVRLADAFALLRTPPRAFDYLYLAPPQYRTMWQQALTILAEHPLLAQPHTQMIVQIDPKEWQAMALPRWQELDRRRYGKTELIFFEAVDPAEI